MSIHLEKENLLNTQEMEVAVNGPDGATHLIICTGHAHLGALGHESYTFLVGPRLSRRQFVAVIASGALSKFQLGETKPSEDKTETHREANLLSITGEYDDECNRVKIRADVSPGSALNKLSISYSVNILAELQKY